MAITGWDPEQEKYKCPKCNEIIVNFITECDDVTDQYDEFRRLSHVATYYSHRIGNDCVVYYSTRRKLRYPYTEFKWLGRK